MEKLYTSKGLIFRNIQPPLLFARSPAGIIFHIKQDQQAFGNSLQAEEIKYTGQWLMKIWRKYAERGQETFCALGKIQTIEILGEEKQKREKPG
jgi:hypothetical protein